MTNLDTLHATIRTKQIEILRVMLGDRVRVDLDGHVFIACDDECIHDITDRLDYMLEPECTLSATDSDDVRDLMCVAYSLDHVFAAGPVTREYGN